ncbi:hypothetical protein ACM61V_20490 [Sphingomonas sp. TX0543]|uniref:hypothetical protein n=1 Tax=Sphingomonas sp. TX0543 TaxID=3399682 RepID=UPI003AFA73F1
MSYARVLMVLAAVMLASGPSLMMSANLAVAAADRTAPVDLTMLMDDTPDIGPVADPPPPLVGAVNLIFMGVLPDERLTDLVSVLFERPSWSLAFCAPLASCSPHVPKRPPRF